jgi:hypothetical protein
MTATVPVSIVVYWSKNESSWYWRTKGNNESNGRKMGRMII